MQNEIQFRGRCDLCDSDGCGFSGHLPLFSESIMITLCEVYERYNDMLNESGPVMIGGVELLPSDILEQMDPVAYDEGFSDYADACNIDLDNIDASDAEYNDSMDGDFDSAMASAGYGTDEDYGYYGD